MKKTPDAPKNLTFWIHQLDWNEFWRRLLRWLYTLSVFCGCTYLVFWRGESGWLFVPACLLLWFRRGL
ncbi:MAG: hypothetical protein PHE83_09380 [Opitutaceae bacterium]|nr:hypothetical protein [Opitutaceae bacterium]